MSGIVQSIVKTEGDSVNPGDVILFLRADEVARRVRQAELNLQSRQLDLARGKAAPREEDIEIARANLRKAMLALAAAEAAYNANPTAQNDAAREIARADLDIARANFNRVMNGLSKEEIEGLQNAVTHAQLELENARAALAQTRLTAPFTATVTEIGVREGELVGGYTPLATIADLRALEIVAEIDEIDVAHVKVGQKVEVRFDAFPGERFAGILTRLYPAASSQRGTTVYTAIVEFDRRDVEVRLGMGANLRILTIEKQGVLLVPNRALTSVGTRKAVRVVAPGEPRDVIVEIGVSDGNETEIISGVNEGDQVLLP
jgi:RND family efflux transporter MFP subunit